jgi:hypothetical protein
MSQGHARQADVTCSAKTTRVAGASTRQHRPKLAAALRAAKSAGLPLRGASISPDGKIELTFGEPDAQTTKTWDQQAIDKAVEGLTK